MGSTLTAMTSATTAMGSCAKNSTRHVAYSMAKPPSTMPSVGEKAMVLVQ